MPMEKTKTARILKIEQELGEELGVFLSREYVERTIEDISTQLSVPYSTLRGWAISFGISLRTKSENSVFLKQFKSPRIREIEKKLNEPLENFLEREYTEKKRMLKSISTQLSVPYGTSRQWLIKFGIRPRTELENRLLFSHKPPREELSEKYKTKSVKEMSKEYGVTERAVKYWLEGYGIKKQHITKPTREELLEWYKTKSSNQLSKEYRVSSSTIHRWLKGYGIKKPASPKLKTENKKVPKKNSQKINSSKKIQKQSLNNNGKRNLTLDNFFSDIQPLIWDYNVLFEKNPEGVINELEDKVRNTNGYEKGVYRLLHSHYLELRDWI